MGHLAYQKNTTLTRPIMRPKSTLFHENKEKSGDRSNRMATVTFQGEELIRKPINTETQYRVPNRTVPA